jgi:hypothetical protein
MLICGYYSSYRPGRLLMPRRGVSQGLSVGLMKIFRLKPKFCYVRVYIVCKGPVL